MNAAPAVGGWAAAALVVVALVVMRRLLTTRMEHVARACHELRGPLTAARLGLAADGREAVLTAARRRAIDTELRRAARVVEDLTEMRRRCPRGEGARSLERVDVLRLVADALEAADALARRSGVLLSGTWDGSEAWVWGDRLRLAQALGNLLANAIEHGGGAVRLQGSVRREVIRIVIDDDGAGLPAPVAVIAARARSGRGRRGRGLAIALEIARDHRGSVVAAPVGRGGRVVLELPVAG